MTDHTDLRRVSMILVRYALGLAPAQNRWFAAPLVIGFAVSDIRGLRARSHSVELVSV